MKQQRNALPEDKSKLKKWAKRVGWLGLIFFTIKGFIWLAVFYFGIDVLNGCLAK
jgi:hypothetical protein